MGFKELKKCWKTEVINIFLAFAVSVLAYFSFNYLNASIQEMFIPVIFLLVLILLRFSDKK